MALEFLLPDIGEGLAEATVVRWLVEVGGTVDRDGVLVEIETDKAVVEMPAPRAGVVLHHGAPAGGLIEVGELLVVIGAPGEVWEPRAEAAGAAPVVGTLAAESERLPAPSPGPAGPQALPAVRKLAADLGVDLAAVDGSGPGGRITEADVRGASATAGLVERVPFSATRRAIADHLSRSWREIPHVWTYGSADAGPLLESRRRHGERRGSPVPLEALLIAAVLPVLAEFPAFNATVGNGELLVRRHYDIGFAVDTPDGLVVAVVAGADDRGVDDLADEVARLADAAREKRAALGELRGATFTVSNIGAVGGGYGTPIIPWGTTAILSVGRADPAPVVRDGQVVAAREFPLSLAYDHRAIDGATGRRFMAALVSRLEQG